nr:MAG TPA: hypothetical protein [Caudoviricetes sp.]
MLNQPIFFTSIIYISFKIKINYAPCIIVLSAVYFSMMVNMILIMVNVAEIYYSSRENRTGSLKSSGLW